MLFNSYAFIFLFLPLCLLGYFGLARVAGREAAFAWMVLASLFFYGWWNPAYLPIILVSTFVNWALGNAIADRVRARPRAAHALLVAGIVANLGLLGYYKYAHFVATNVATLAGTTVEMDPIVLPLAISFFTFTQIAYLIDAHRGVTERYSLMHYALFVVFFPHLIAGPIVHYRELLPQFLQPAAMRIDRGHVAAGLTIFAIGLFKKAVLADGISAHSSPLFDAAASGDAPTLFYAWGAALGYTMQLYFDFSGYSDMAIGASRLFGIHLPINFHSPYKATSIIDFWRRWHITLSRFLRDYLYIPLGGGRCSLPRRHANLMVTMLLGGLWHGAGWTFVMWGGLHGLYLVVNHAFRAACDASGLSRWRSTRAWQAVAWLLTFVAVVVGWVYFRAHDFDSANRIVAGMAGLNGVSLPAGIAARLGPAQEWLAAVGVGFDAGGGAQLVALALWLAVLLPAAVLLPNSQEFMGRHDLTLREYDLPRGQGPIRRLATLEWAPTRAWARALAVLAVAGILALTSVSEFLYFQF